MTRFLRLPAAWRTLVAASSLALAGCATTSAPPPSYDPLEAANRALYAFNAPLDRDIIFPVVRAYKEYVHPVPRQILTNFLNNIEDFISGVNGVLQNKPDKAGHDFGRVMVNTLFGIGGLIDFASDAGIPRGDEDFGQTLGYWGVPQGPFLFVPLIGPTTVRDGSGIIVDAYIAPITYIDSVRFRNSMYGLAWFDARVQAYDAQQLVGGAALDPYAFTRRAYLQRRLYLVHDGNPPPAKEDE